MTRAAMGLPPDATKDAVRHRYKELAQKLHPDRGGTTADFQRLQANYVAALAEAQGDTVAAVAPSCPECEGNGFYWMGGGFSRMRFTCIRCSGAGYV